MDDNNSLVPNRELNNNSPEVLIQKGQHEQVSYAMTVVEKVMKSEDNFLSRFLPTDEIIARREQDVALIKSALADRNEIYRLLRQTEIRNFKEVANRYLSVEAAKGKFHLATLLTEAINKVTERFKEQTETFHDTLQEMADNAEKRQGSLAKKFKDQTDKEIDLMLEQFSKLKGDLLIELVSIKDELLN